MAKMFRPRGDVLHEDKDSNGEGGASGAHSHKTAEFRTINLNKEQVQKFASNHVTTAKYNILSFLPKFLFEQFRRYANVFFLIIGLLQQIPNVSPTGRYVTLVPFTIILALTAMKELIEDFYRHRDDSQVNNTYAKVYNFDRGIFVERRWKEIVVGDIVHVENEKPFPADLILLSSSQSEGMCHIETANLDGETNLKLRTALPTTDEKFEDEISISLQGGVVNCELPNRVLYEFKGNIQLDGEDRFPVSNDTILLRGSKLKSTPWINGLVVFTGHETKLMMNSTKPPLKRSRMDIMTNYQIIYLFIILISMALLSSIGSLVLSTNGENHYYVGAEDGTSFFMNFLTFIILYNNLIPISLLVTLEMVKFFQAFFVSWDKEMYHEASDTVAHARTSNLNEELGQVKYVFSDKTGTLTQNVMEFKSASVAGTEYHVDGVERLHNALDVEDAHSKQIQDFLIHLSVCHSVVPQGLDKLYRTPADFTDLTQRDFDSLLSYSASSPDEEALVKGASHFGYTFFAKSQTTYFVRVRDGSDSTKDLHFEFKDIIEFDSKRKRMSIIFEIKTAKSTTYKMFIKGADNIILSRLAAGGRNTPYYAETLGHIKLFAERGLRTLCLASKELTREEFETWHAKYKSAKSDISGNRDSLMEAAADLIECDLTLVGATGIEDKLQDGVPQAIDDLLNAGINVWMLTGDKQETAINIGGSCNLLKHNGNLMIIDTPTKDETRDVINRYLADIRAQSSSGRVAPNNELVISGESLTEALDHALRTDFIELCCMCASVICCRVSPMQKADMVELVQKHTKAICLSIGDGANDVAMIQKANVGVGISGNEGLQAANTSDFAIAQFRFLTRLLFVHGAWFNARNSKVILYSFYKNICLYIIELWFAIYSYWTGQVLFERWTIGFYNMLMTALPPIAIGLFDQNCKAETRMNHPRLYKTSQKGDFFNLKVFWIWIANATVHSMILYWLPMFAFDQGIVWSSGRSSDYLVLGNIVYSCVVITVCLKAGLTLDSWNWLCHLAIWGSVTFWFAFLLVYSYVWPLGIKIAANMAGMAELVYTTPAFWLCILFVPFVTLIPDILWLSLNMTVNPTETDKMRMAEKVQAAQVPSEGSSLLGPMSRIFKSKATDRSAAQAEMELQASSGYAFSQDESGVQEKIVRQLESKRPKSKSGR